MARYTMEQSYRIYDDHGAFAYVGPDADGLDMIEVRNCDKHDSIINRVFLNHEEARLVAVALNKYLDELPLRKVEGAD